MNASVKALGYAVIAATDLDAWYDFGVELLGLHCAERSEERLLLRMDEYAYRLDVRRSDHDGIDVLGWDVGSEAALEELSKRLADTGFAVDRLGAEEAAQRRVSGLVRFRDPDDGFDIELFWGLANTIERFVSPTGARFVAGNLGLGHVFQRVRDKAAYRRLFGDILGFRLSDHIDMEPGVTGDFLRCNSRHHSFAVVDNLQRPAGIGHLMLEVDDLDIIGRAYDRVLGGAAPLLSTFGKHTNDKMLSFYVRTPSGFGIEYGTGGILVDEETWLPTRYDVAHYWGHQRNPS
ncbi:VOC family protein [Streptomyces sp. NPDC002577]